MHTYRIFFENRWVIIKILNFLDHSADLLEDFRKKASGGEEEYSAYKYLKSKNNIIIDEYRK